MPENIGVPLEGDRYVGELCGLHGFEVWNSACLSRCSRVERPLVELYLERGGFSGPCTGESLPLRVDFIHRVEFEEVSG